MCVGVYQILFTQNRTQKEYGLIQTRCYPNPSYLFSSSRKRRIQEGGDLSVFAFEEGPVGVAAVGDALTTVVLVLAAVGDFSDRFIPFCLCLLYLVVLDSCHR